MASPLQSELYLENDKRFPFSEKSPNKLWSKWSKSPFCAMEHKDTTCDRQSLSPDAEGIFCGGVIVGLLRTAPWTAALGWCWSRMRQGELALGYRHFVLWPHICCHVGKQQTLPSKTHECQHLPFTVRETWEKKEDTAIHYVAHIKYLANGLALAVSICFKNKDFCFFKVHSEGKILPDSSNLIGPQSILKVCICIQLYMQPGKKICKKKYISVQDTSKLLKQEVHFFLIWYHYAISFVMKIRICSIFSDHEWLFHLWSVV